jgi:nitrogenase molybdenum-iron protein alpha/beta subunit
MGMPRILSSDLTEEDVIFGGEPVLEETIRSAARGRPGVVVVLSTCVAGTIGDDVAALCREDYGVPVVHVPAAGFMDGGFHDGTLQALIALGGMAQKTGTDGSVNLIGEKSLEFEVEEHYRELRRLLDLLGVQVNLRFVHDIRTADIGRLGRASLNILREPALAPAGDAFRARFDTPCLDTFPIGMSGTLIFLEKVGDLLDRDSSAAITYETRYQHEVLDRFEGLRGQKVRLDTASCPPGNDACTRELLEILDLDTGPGGCPVPLPDPFPVGTTGILRLLHRWRRCVHA